MKINKNIYNYINFELLHYKIYKEELKNIRCEIIETGATAPALYENINMGIRSQGQNASPTENKAISLITTVSVLALEKTIRAIENALQTLHEDHNRIFYEVYQKNRKDFYKLAIEMGMSYETFNRRKFDLIERVGIELGVLKILTKS